VPTGAWTWVEIPNSRIDDGLPDYVRTTGPPRYPDMLTDAESGGCVDPVGRRAWVPLAGGHNDWYHNLVLRLDLDGGAGWQVDMHGTQPVTDLNDVGYSTYHDGKPGARHTYGCVQYSPKTDTVWVLAGSLWRNGDSDSITWLWDCQTKKFRRGAPFVDVNGNPLGRFGMYGAYDPVTDEVWFDDDRRMNVYNFAQDAYRKGSNTFATRGTRMVVALDWVGRRVYAVTRNKPTTLRTFKLDVPYQQNSLVEHPLTGATEIFSTIAPGGEWDPELQRIVVWNGTRTVYLCDPLTRTVETLTPAGVDPGPCAANGTMGRFRRLGPGEYVLVNRVKQNCLRLLYRAAAPPDAVAPPAPAKARLIGVAWDAA
jgi:hypothetical protein